MFGGLKAIHMNHQRTRQERKPSCIQYIFKYGSLDAPVLPWASAYGCSQLKRQKLMMGGYTEKVFKWFNYMYPCARAHPGCEVTCQGVPSRLALSLRPCFLEASPTVEKAVSCYKVDQLVALLPSFSSVQSSLAVCKFRSAEEER